MNANTPPCRNAAGRLRSAKGLHLSIFLALGFTAAAAVSAPIARSGLWNSAIPSRSGTADAMHRSVACGPGKFLIGLVLYQTDRVVDLAYECVGSSKEQQWNDVPDQALPMFERRPGDAVQRLGCPKNYFLVGLTATLGTYSAAAKGSLTVTPPDLIADLHPVCRNGRTDDVFVFPLGRLRKANEAHLHEVGWDGVNGSRSCAPGYAATSLVMTVDARRNLSPDRRFEDIALVCDKLPTDPAMGSPQP